MAVQTGVQMAALLTPAQTEALAAFIGGILRPIVKEEVEEAFKLFKDKATISKGNDALQTQFPL